MKTPEEIKRSSYLKDGMIKENDELTAEQEKQLKEAIRQADAGETMPWEELKTSIEEWRKKQFTRKILMAFIEMYPRKTARIVKAQS